MSQEPEDHHSSSYIEILFKGDKIEFYFLKSKTLKELLEEVATKLNIDSSKITYEEEFSSHPIEELRGTLDAIYEGF